MMKGMVFFMKQEMISFLTTIKDEIYNLSKYLYENPEKSFYEHKAYDYITKMLKNYKFNVTEHYLDIDTAFYAEYGSGHPKICYICEYDALEKEGHVSGHNLITSMSVAAGLALCKVADKLGCTVILLGCPGEYTSGTKVTMSKQGTFNDIDAVLMAHPDIITAENGTSNSILPIKIKYKSKENYAYKKSGTYSALDACLFTFNAINILVKGFEEGCSIDGVIAQGGSMPSLLPSETECKFYIRTPKIAQAEEIDKKIRELVKVTSNIMNISSEITLYELPYEELVPNDTLTRIFAHNLKENGIIDIDKPKNNYSGLSLGTVSHIVPCIHPYISIVDKDSIQFPSPEFAAATVTPFALKRVMNAAQALAATGLDLIEKEELLKESKEELHRKISENK